MEVLVIDRGPGLRPAQRSALLVPTERLTTEGGTSLGLSVAAGLLELLKGELRLEDTPGGGLTVVVQFPLTSHDVSL
jgi:two-component system sensor histidine kinase KdpD